MQQRDAKNTPQARAPFFTDYVVSAEKGRAPFVLPSTPRPAGTSRIFFYSVKGSLGGKLSVSDTGNLLWNVESITSTFFSPATSSFTIGGTSYVFRYTFDTSGLLMSQEKTEEVVNFRK